MAAAEISGVGAHDFALFYVSAKSWALGLNPYDPQILQQTGNQLFGSDQALPPYFHFIYPPIFLPVIAPFLLLPFSASLLLYLLVSFSSLLLVPFLLNRLIWSSESLPLRTLFVLSLFPPGYECLRWGGLGLILALILTASVILVERKCYFGGGVLGAFLFVKPHLFLLFLVWLVCRGGMRSVLGMLTAILFFLVILFIRSPDIFAWWLGGAAFLREDVVTLRGTGVGDLIQAWLLPRTGVPLPWLPFFIAGVATIISLGISLFRPGSTRIDFLPLVLAISVGIAPYGWFHDSSLLIVSLAMLMFLNGGIGWVLPILALQIFTIIWGAAFATHQGDFAWYPWAVAGFCLIQSLTSSNRKLVPG